MKIAIIDIGNIKLKLLIAEHFSSDKRSPAEGRVEFKNHALTCLGVRLDENGGVIERKRIDDTLKALEKFKIQIAKFKVDKIKVISTHVLRVAKNAPEVIAEIKKKTGLEVEVIDQKHEAELFFKGVISDFTHDQTIAAADVGSGSVQVVIGNRHGVKSHHLFKTGAQRVQDTIVKKHLPTDLTTRDEFKRMRGYIASELAELPEAQGLPLVFGSSSFLDFFNVVDIPLHPHSHSPSHPHQVYAADMEEFLDKIIDMTYEGREVAYPFSQKSFMWGIDKAFLNILEIAKRLHSPYIIPSNANINKGLLYEKH